MLMHSCNICNKQFKTTQHLNQHKNRKKSCVPNVDNASNNSSVSSVSSIFLKKIMSPSLHNYSDKQINNGSSEKTDFELTLDNILNFVKTAQEIQKLLQDKEQIDEYKNQIIQLQNENLQLKNKLGLVNRIIKDKGNVDAENEIIEDSTPFII